MFPTGPQFVAVEIEKLAAFAPVGGLNVPENGELLGLSAYTSETGDPEGMPAGIIAADRFGGPLVSVIVCAQAGIVTSEAAIAIATNAINDFIRYITREEYWDIMPAFVS